MSDVDVKIGIILLIVVFGALYISLIFAPFLPDKCNSFELYNIARAGSFWLAIILTFKIAGSGHNKKAFVLFYVIAIVALIVFIGNNNTKIIRDVIENDLYGEQYYPYFIYAYVVGMTLVWFWKKMPYLFVVPVYLFFWILIWHQCPKQCF